MTVLTQDDAHSHYSKAIASNLTRLNSLLGNPYMTWHIALMLVAYVGLLPAGVALGRSRHWLHVPLQIAMTVCAGIGYYLAFHRHDYNSQPQKQHHSTKSFFKKSPHVWLGIMLAWLLGIQVMVGVVRKILKTRWPDQNADKTTGTRMVHAISSALSIGHRWIGGVHIFVIFMQIILGVVKMGHFCQADAADMCWRQYTSGSLLWWWALTRLLGLVAPRLFGRGWSKRQWDAIALVLFGIIILVRGYNRQESLLLGLIWSIGGVASLIARYVNRYRVKGVQPIISTTFTITGLLYIFTGEILMRIAGACIIGASILDGITGWMGWRRRYRYQQIGRDNAESKSRKRFMLCGHGLPPARTTLRLVSGLCLLWAGMLTMSSTEEWRQFITVHGLSTNVYMLLLGALAILSMTFILSLGSLVSERPVIVAVRTILAIH
ncbi:hypothetical protein BDF19DRAFT_455408 [Syncephalis fuscata]|nr:hypothetical protein BDF19DRAFT_455408 [Syncephalis fuscata]